MVEDGATAAVGMGAVGTIVAAAGALARRSVLGLALALASSAV
jgi:hypothetical protein